MKQNLIIVRCGDKSLHPLWLPAEGQQASWDLILNYYGDEATSFSDLRYPRIDTKGPKYMGLNQLLKEYWEIIREYKYIWFPDDDLRFTCEDANRLFEYCHKYNVAIAQPALHPSSYIALPITLANPLFDVRFTSVVEVMAPCFEVGALSKVKETFCESLTGCGLDFVWPTRLGSAARRVAVIDAVTVVHTRPVGGPNHNALRERGSSALEEIEQVMRRFGVQRRHYYVWSGVLKNARMKLEEPRIVLLVFLFLGTVLGAIPADKWPAGSKWRSILSLFRAQFRRPQFGEVRGTDCGTGCS
jgi:hypothetical protein